MRGIEPPSQAWEACVLPLNHIRLSGRILPAPLNRSCDRGASSIGRTDRLRPPAIAVVGFAPMILSDRSIREEIARGRIEIDPFDDRCVQPSSVDLHVDRKFRTFHNARYPYIDVKLEMPELTELVEVEDDTPFILHPGEFVLGSTQERVRIPDDLVARLEGKSSLGRLGLLIHSTAGYVDPGWDGYLTLELSNVANLPITIYPKMKIGQISFFRLTTAAEQPYGSGGRGKYQGQRGPTASRFFEEFDREAGRSR